MVLEKFPSTSGRMKKWWGGDHLLQEHRWDSKHSWARFPLSGVSTKIKLCSVPLQFLTVTHSASLAPCSDSEPDPQIAGTAIKTPRNGLLGRSQVFHGIPELPDKLRRILSRAWTRPESSNSSNLISEWFLAHLCSVPMASISSDPHSHPHNGKKIKSSFDS